MKKYLALFLSLLFIIGALALTASAARDVYVADPDVLLSDESVAELNGVCAGLSGSNGCEVYVYIAKTLGGETCEACAARLFESENVGGNERRGVVFVAAQDDGDYYMKAGAGVGEHLAYEDIVSLLTEKFEPDFAAGEIERGTVSTVYSLCERLSKLTEADLIARKEAENKGPNPFVVILLIILALAVLCVLVFVILYIRAERIRRKRRRRRVARTYRR